MTNHKLPKTIDLSKVILWQYNKAQRLQDLVKALEESAEICSSDIWSKIETLFNINNPIDSDDAEYLKYREIGLVLVSRLFGVDRPVYPDDVEITRAQELELFRRCIKGKIYLMDSDGSVPDINEFLRIVFPEINSYVKDNFDMTIQYVFPESLSSDFKHLAALRDTEGFLPHPSGVLIGERVKLENYRLALQQYNEDGTEVDIEDIKKEVFTSERWDPELADEKLNNLDNATFIKD